MISTRPTTFTFITEGVKTLFEWVKDAAGNVSSPRSQTITITMSSLSVNPNELAESVHFAGSSSENASVTMDIEIKGIHDELLSVGDELAVFDGSTCVSSMVLSADDLTDGFVRITAPLSDENQKGFTNGSFYPNLGLECTKRDRSRDSN